MRAIITVAAGMVGERMLIECLESPKVESVVEYICFDTYN